MTQIWHSVAAAFCAPALAVLAGVAVARAGEAPACPVRVVDGDTVVVDGERVRLAGLDAPEIGRARCEDERRRGEAARARLEEMVCRPGARVAAELATKGTERYGRALARIMVDGVDVAEALIAEGHALARKPRRGWCVGE